MGDTRIIRGQTITGTRLDKHGERLTREDLERLIQGWTEVQSAVEHDLSRPPVCQAFNPRLEEEPDGELSLKVDVEVFDEEAFSAFGGFSVSYFRKRVRIGQGPAALTVTVNPRQHDFDGMVAAIAQAVGKDSDAIDVRERVEKADVATTAIVSVIVFVTLQTVGGFLNAAGAALFDLTRKQKRTDDPNAPTTVQFHLHVQLVPERVTQIILVMDSKSTAEDLQAIDGPAVLEAARARLGESAKRIVGRVLPGGEVRIESVIERRAPIAQVERKT